MITHNNTTYKLFDAHTHAFPDAIAQSAIGALSHNADIPFFHDGRFASLCEFESRADGFLLLPIATKPHQTHAVNTWAAQKIGGKALAFGSVHPDSRCLTDELNELCRLGLRGIKFHPEYQQFFVDEERCFPLYEAIFAHGLPIVFHAGADLAYSPPYHCTPKRLAHVLDAFPAARIIAAHMGGFQMEREAADLLAGRDNLWIDTAYAAGLLPPDQFDRLLAAHRKDRILFATDAPWMRLDEAINAILSADLTPPERSAIFYDNAATLLGLPK